MAKEKEPKSEFTVTDRRLFNMDGEIRHDVVEDEERRAQRELEKSEAQQRLNEERAAQQQQTAAATIDAPADSGAPAETDQHQPPSAEEQAASAEAYKQSTEQIDDRIRKELRKQGQWAKKQDFEMTFDKFVASLYMSALVQLGLAAPQGAQPQVDLIGARQTIDTIALLQDKTKGNLTAAEENMLQNCLYELRMAYLEVTNLITNPPPAKGNGGS